jgi:hypothetical protein
VQLSWICIRHMIELSGFFLEKIMAKLGFDQRWIKLVMACVTSV